MGMFLAPTLPPASDSAHNPTDDSVILPSSSTLLLGTRGAKSKREIKRPEIFSTKMLQILENILKSEKVSSFPILNIFEFQSW